MTSTESRIAIVGAGAFGLSTALHLAKTGYRNVTVFDYQPYDINAYNSDEGCDSASSDVNKIYRCSYGHEVEYQDLAFSGRPVWLEWNEMISSTSPEDLPQGLTPDTKLFVDCGLLRFSMESELSQYDKDCLEELEKAGLRHWQHIVGDERDMKRLKERIAEHSDEKWDTRLSLARSFQEGKLASFLDISAGLTYADKACIWVRYLCEKAGVKFVLGQKEGKLENLIINGAGYSKKIKGLETADGKEHFADVTIVACGGWTPSVVQDVNGILQTTAGSVITIQLPKERQDLWDKYSPDNFAVWSYGVTTQHGPEYGGFYGFPRTPEGKIKIGYRGRKWTNYQLNPKTNTRLSVPRTKYTEEKAVNLPKKAISNLKELVGDMFPDLKEVGITDTRMCWYTDSLDNSFVIDYVPGYNKTLFVASGGSGHGFKFLPVLGQHVVNQLEGKTDVFTPIWKWRFPTPGSDPNGLIEGEHSGRDLGELEMADKKDWQWK
ncbi:FAD dependent oxidoreductase [Mollisia scopiformis]|uniref:FAD dependent oxidoreductase n=1 Tax=Mollisia scopiformis TaxID=149040 RepID=A0A194X1I8_MOLSC|nr:FAD dependent oxidoreductase [Mollisia scopiformis]KUJ13712.1 FAD dependent oxidoreductase [Mollisia scopiformis]